MNNNGKPVQGTNYQTYFVTILISQGTNTIIFIYFQKKQSFEIKI